MFIFQIKMKHGCSLIFLTIITGHKISPSTKCQQVKKCKRVLHFKFCRSLALLETVLKTNLAGPVLKDLAVMHSSIADVEEMQTIL